MPDNTGPSWKNPGGNAQRPASSRKAWQPGKPTNPQAAKKTGGRPVQRLIIAGVTGAVLIALLVRLILLFWPVGRPSLVNVAPSHAALLAVPENSAGAFAAGDLAENLKKRKQGPLEVGGDAKAPTVETWHQRIDKSKNPLVLYFPCPGAADKSGPFLWLVPADAKSAEPGHRLFVRDILKRLGELPAERQKLLIFDATADSAAWARGQLMNDFARKLLDLEGDIKGVENLVVICSSDKDQRSWVSDELRQTAFGYYLHEGLLGAAGTPNDRITALKLFAYLQTSVSKWAQANRQAEQTPIILPAGEMGERRAAEIIVNVLGPEEYKPATVESRSGTFDALDKAWLRYEELSQQSPAPETKAPHLWRQYLDLLLRAERIARVTGEVPTALSETLTNIANELAPPQWKDLTCVPFSLPAGRALGFTRPILAPDTFSSVWVPATAPERHAQWDAVAQKLGPNRLADSVRLAGVEAVLQHLLTGPLPEKDAVARADDLLSHIGGPFPVETHLLRIFKEHLDSSSRPPTLVRLALDVHADGERASWFAGRGDAYPYGEQVARWFGARLGEADTRRRHGLDLVFASDKDSWDKAEVELKAAKDLFAAIGKDAEALGAAFRLRDRALSRLPYYAHWAANRRITAKEAEPEIALVEKSAAKAHDLAEILEVPDIGKLNRVKVLVAELDGGDNPGLYRSLENQFEESIAKLEVAAANAANWHTIDAALSVPFIAPKKRRDVLARLLYISSQLQKEQDAQGAKPPTFPPQEMARRQGRMAMAVLGERGVREMQGASPLGWSDLKRRIDNDGGAWWDDSAAAGEQIGNMFRQLPAEAATAAGEDAKGAQLARLCEGATAPVGRNPAAVERRYWTHKLLVEQAKRAAADGWADTDKVAAQPYALLAAGRYLDSAVSVLFDGEPSENDPRRKDIEKVRSGLAVPRFELSSPNRLDITDRPVETLPYTIKRIGDSSGYPVVRVRKVLLPLVAKEAQNTYRVVSEFVGPAAALPQRELGFTVDKPETGSTSNFDLDLLFRGHLANKPVEARVASRTLEWVYNPPPDSRATFAIKGDDALSSGAVAILFDWSLSMKDPSPDGKQKKYQEAAHGLKNVLAQLEPGTFVSVTRFGSGTRGVLDEPILRLTRWGNRPQEQAKALEKSIVEKEPDGSRTPLAEAIVQSLKTEGIFPGRDFTGFRTLIVLTDGEDNPDVEPGTTPPHPGKKILAALQESPQDIGLKLLLFGLDDAEYEAANNSLKVIEDARGYKSNRTPAQIWGSKSKRLLNAADILGVLKDEMQPRISIRPHKSDDAPIRLPVSIVTDKRWQWMLPLQKPGVFGLSAFGVLEQEVELKGGDRLILALRRGSGGAMEFSLPSYADAITDPAVTARTTSTDKSVVLTVPRNSLTPRGGTYDLDLTATLEKPRIDPRRLKRETPLFAWFDVTPQNGNGLPPSLKVENLHYRPAPAWRITAPWVPKAGEAALNRFNGATPRVDAYWLGVEPTAKFTKDFSSLKAIEREFAEKDRRFSVDGTDVELDISHSANGVLTVRVLHTAKKPILVRAKVQGVEQDRTLREEHRFYDGANRYTAIFGPFDSADNANRVTLEFFTIDSLRANSKHLTIDLPRGPVAESPDLLEEFKLFKE